jgi:glycosyltransferase involved in cell wall biosynthesis
MRILVVQETDWIDRNPILHHRMLEALSIAGDDVTVLDHEILWGRRGLRPLWQPRRVWTDVSKVLPGSRVTVVRPAMLRVPAIARFSWLLTTWLELRRYIRTERPDVIVAYGLSNAFIALLYARRHRIRFVFHLFDSLHALAEPKALQPVAAIVEGQLLRSADRVVIPYKALATYVARIGVRPGRVRRIPHGMTRRRVDPAGRAAWRSRFGISDDDVALLFIGWLYRHSGLAEMATELARDPTAYGRFKLVIVGDGDLSSTLEDIRTANGLGDHIIMTGRRPVEEMTEFIAASDVCLLPSLPTDATRYIVPTKVDEYLELGRPVVATALEGMRTEYGDAAGIIWTERPVDVLPRLAELLSGPTPQAEVLADLSSMAADYAATRDDWETVTHRFREVLSSASPR